MNKQITILCGQSASGKDTILRKLVSDYNYLPLISCTTRKMREHEVDGKDYWFIDNWAFKSMIENNRLIEYRSYNTLVNGIKDIWLYGLSKSELDRVYPNQKYVVILDIKGIQSLLDYYGKDKCEVIYIDCPSEVRKERAMKRGGYDEIEFERRYLADLTDFSEQNRIGLVDREVKNYDRKLDDVVEEIVKEKES